MHIEELSDLSLDLPAGYTTLRNASKVLATYGINIDAVCVPGGSDASCHLLVRNGDHATEVLARHGMTVLATRRVHALRVPNRPGTLTRVLELLAPHEHLVEFIYQATDRGLVLGSNDPELVLLALAPLLKEATAA
jgi:hypothetical protein